MCSKHLRATHSASYVPRSGASRGGPMADERSFDEVLVALWEQGVTRREAVRTIGLGVGVLGTAGWLAACGSDDDDDDAKSSAAPKKGGVLVVGAEADAYVLSGDEANVGQYPLNANIFEGLVRMDPDYGIVPVLAE